MTVSPAVLSATGIVKSFGATRAVRDVSLEIPARSIVGLVGENGAGKSTLAKIFAGIHSPDAGQVHIEGRPVELNSPREGIKAGVSMMAQEILLVPDATVEENVLLGALPRRGIFPRHRQMRTRFQELVELTGFDLDPRAKVSSLRIADQQKVELMRALSQDSRLIIMDEPSAALTADEVARLHQAIREIAGRGASILLISHFLEEVLDLTDHVAIMRDGQLVRSGPTADETVDKLVAGMVGKALATDYTHVERAEDRAVRLSVRGLSRKGAVDDVSFDIKQGEILGLAGLVGAGRSEIGRLIYGVDRRDGGVITVDGEAVEARHPGSAIREGVFMIPESRKEQGLVLTSSITDNLVLSTLGHHSRSGITMRRRINSVSHDLAEGVDLRYGKLTQPAGSLSGGNQQKILFGRALDIHPKVLIVDEPTRGVDIAAKRAIHAKLQELAAEGLAVLFISSEIDEVLGVCNRVLVITRGRVQAEFLPPYDQETVVAAFFGKSGSK